MTVGNHNTVLQAGSGITVKPDFFELQHKHIERSMHSHTLTLAFCISWAILGMCQVWLKRTSQIQIQSYSVYSCPARLANFGDWITSPVP